MSLSLTQWLGLLALLALLIQGARAGYRRGPVRQLSGLLALALAAPIAWLAGPPAGRLLLADSAIPWMLRDGAGMVGVGLLAWLTGLAWFWHIGRRPKGAEEAESPVLGAMVGCWTGLLSVALLLLALTAWAGLNEAILRPEDAAKHWAVAARESLAELPGAQWLHGCSPWPEHWGRIVHKAQRALANPEASKRLMEQEPIRALAATPSFYTAWGDPEIKRLVREGRLIDAAQHPKARALLNDETFQRQLLELDLESLVDKSLMNK